MANFIISCLWIAVGITSAETTLLPAGGETTWRYLDGKIPEKEELVTKKEE